MKHLILLFAGCALLSSCSTPKTHSGFEQGVAFSKVKSYAFVPDKAMVAAEGLSNASVWYDELEKAIRTELASKKIEQGTIAKRDVFVAFHVVRKSQQTTILLNNYSGYKISKKAAAQADLSKIIGEADSGTVTLVIDVIDPVKKEIIWRGWIQTDAKPALSNAQRQKAIRKLVHRVLADFPPKE